MNLKIAIVIIGLSTSYNVFGQDQLINGNVEAGGSSGIYWRGFKSNGSTGQWGFQQSNIMMVGIGGNVYDRGFSTNAMGIFNGSTTKEDVYLHNQNSPTSDFLVLKNTGNVGIGVVQPQFKLDTYGSGRFDNGIAGSSIALNISGGALNLLGGGPQGSYGSPPDKYPLRLYEGYGWNFTLQNIINPGFAYSALRVRSASDQILFQVRADGNVGIGSNDPDEKLTVKGKIHAEEVKVDLSVPGPDYVFNDDYQLTPLSEIQSYIKTNKHLPNVPSAKEMEEKGINLSEMNMLLLKKVEELTLHLIKQNEEIQILKKLIKN